MTNLFLSIYTYINKIKRKGHETENSRKMATAYSSSFSSFQYTKPYPPPPTSTTTKVVLPPGGSGGRFHLSIKAVKSPESADPPPPATAAPKAPKKPVYSSQ